MELIVRAHTYTVLHTNGPKILCKNGVALRVLGALNLLTLTGKFALPLTPLWSHLTATTIATLASPHHHRRPKTKIPKSSRRRSNRSLFTATEVS